MKLEAVVVCVNYADFLAHTLPHNKNHFDRIVVVTDSKDEATRLLCEHYHVECVVTDCFYENGDNFNKGRGINAGLSRLTRQGWVVHFDADIYLPPLTRTILENISDELDPHAIYGIDRLMCPTYDAWMDYVDSPKPINEGWIYTHGTAFPLGVRIAEYMNKNAGWEPIGYFQMWNPTYSSVYTYPNEHGGIDRSDVLHAKKFPRSKRQLIPELFCIHLESEGLDVSQMGKNWNGRKTALFSRQTDASSAVAVAVETKPTPKLENDQSKEDKKNLPYKHKKDKKLPLFVKIILGIVAAEVATMAYLFFK